METGLCKHYQPDLDASWQDGTSHKCRVHNISVRQGSRYTVEEEGEGGKRKGESHEGGNYTLIRGGSGRKVYKGRQK